MTIGDISGDGTAGVVSADQEEVSSATDASSTTREVSSAVGNFSDISAGTVSLKLEFV